MLSFASLTRRLVVGLPLLAAQVAAAGTILSSKDKPIEPVYPIGAVKEPFAKAVGRVFEINGTAGYFSGTNAWWLGHLTRDADVDLALTQIKETGYKIIRVWGFGDVDRMPNITDKDLDPDRVWFQFLNITGGYINYGENGLQRLDYVVSKCEQMGLKIVLPFTNYWTEGGGVSMWTEVYTGDLIDWWYEVPKIQEVYRDYIKVIVNRYRNSPAIFSYELMNQPRCPMCAKKIMRDWATSTSAYVKSLDPNHMIALGDEGWLDPEDAPGAEGPGYDGTDGNEYVKNMLNIKTLDYAVFHLYPELWGYDYDWGIRWIEDHDRIGEKVNKPMFLEEYGVSRLVNHTKAIGPYQEAILKSGIAADQFWQMSPTGMAGLDVASRFRDPMTVFYKGGEYERICKQHAAAMGAKTVAAAGALAKPAAPGRTLWNKSWWKGPEAWDGDMDPHLFESRK